MNIAKCNATGETAVFLQFGRELGTTDEVQHGIHAVIHNENFVSEITPHLKKFANMTKEIKMPKPKKITERSMLTVRDKRTLFCSWRNKNKQFLKELYWMIYILQVKLLLRKHLNLCLNEMPNI